MRTISLRSYFTPLALIASSLFFFIICLNYSSQINLWGDEAFSLTSSESNIKNILIGDPTHTPIYYLVLKLIMTLGIHKEVLLRAIHIIPFIIGLIVGYWILVNIFSNTRSALISLCISIILPNYVFYATNIRMYSLLFMFSMIFIAMVAVVLKEDRNDLNYFQLTALGISSLALLLIDYSGIIYFLVGLIYLIIQSLHIRSYKPLIPVLASSSLFLVIIFSFHNIFESIQNILNWSVSSSPASSSQNIGIFGQGVEFAKLVYLSLRPGLDLIYGAGINPILATGLPIVLLLLYAYSFVSIWKVNKNNLPVQLILLSSVIWLFVAPTGYSLTRIFLPSQFFMIAIIIQNISTMNRIGKVVYWLILGVMIAACLKELINPTLRIYSLIPYQKIATETLEVAKQKEVKVILLSANSLNTLSIERYLKQQLIDSKTEEIKIVRLENDTAKEIAEDLNSPLIFISHMKERDSFTDVKALSNQLNKSFQKVKGYINLQNLPYNSLWKNRIINTAHQPYAVQSYLLKNRLGSKGGTTFRAKASSK